MKKVTAFVGSARKRHTYAAVQQFLNNLKLFGDVEYEIVVLSDHRIEICRGCSLCLNKGEELCPLKDHRDELIEKIMSSDGVVIASPNYSFQVSAITKAFLDRLGFVFHRPRFFGKAFTSIVAQGVYGGGKIVKYLDFVGRGLGFNTVMGTSITTREPLSSKRQAKIGKTLSRQSARFHKRLMGPAYPVPPLSKLFLFRMSRTTVMALDESYRDYNYYRDKGWFDSEYYYPIHLNVLKKITGRLADSLATRMAEKSSQTVSGS